MADFLQLLVHPEDTMSDIERRRYKRVNLTLPVRWATSRGVCEGHLTVIGLGGCLIAHPEKAKIGEYIVIEIQLPSGETWVSLPGEVLYHVEEGFGVKFSPMSEQKRVLLNHLIEFIGRTPP
jgi:hypothetical protein